jgi:glutathione peroxidase
MRNLFFVAVMCFFGCQSQAIKKRKNKTEIAIKQNIYQFKVEDLSGNTFDFIALRKK